MRLAPMYSAGRLGSGSASAGMAAIAVTATAVGAATASRARPKPWLLASPPTAATPITWWCQPRRSPVSRTISARLQYAAKLGFRTVAIARGQDKAPLARQFGAHHYIDSAVDDPAADLQKLGGANAILATASSADAMNSVQGGLAANGTLSVIGAVEPLTIDGLQLLTGRRSGARHHCVSRRQSRLCPRVRPRQRAPRARRGTHPDRPGSRNRPWRATARP
jgi:Zinc-binding dehydrogenase